MGHYACDMRPEWFESECKPKKEKQLSSTEENMQALPLRLRGRGDFLRERGRIKDSELMYDAASEIERLRKTNNSNFKKENKNGK